MRIEIVQENTPSPKAWFHHVVEFVQLLDIRKEGNYGVEIGVAEDGRTYIQILKERQDTFTGEYGTGRGGQRFLHPDMRDGEIARLVFGALLAYDEHENREAFTYKGTRIFGPHIDIEALVEAGRHIEGVGKVDS